jgi:hypothetical protein
MVPAAYGQDETILVANFVNGNSVAFNSRVYLFNPSSSGGDVTVRVFTLPVSGGTAQELTTSPLNLGSLASQRALNIKLAEDILAPLGITLPYTDNGGNLALEFTIPAPDVRGTAQVFSSDFAFGTYPLQEIPATPSESPTVLVANFTNGNDAVLNSRVYLWNPSTSPGNVRVRVFRLPLTGSDPNELVIYARLDLGTLGARSGLNVKLAEDILTPLGVTPPYTFDGGNLTLEFTIEAPDVTGTAQVFSSDFAFGTYPLQEVPATLRTNYIPILDMTASADILFPSDGATFETNFSLFSQEPVIALPIVGSVFAEFFLFSILVPGWIGNTIPVVLEGSINALATLSISTITIASCTVPTGTAQVEATYQVSGLRAGTVSGKATVFDDLARVGGVPVCLDTDVEPTLLGVPPGAQASIDLVPLANGPPPPVLPPFVLGDGTAPFSFADTINQANVTVAFPPGFTQAAPLAFGRWQIFPPGTHTVSLILTVEGIPVAEASSSFTVTEGP